MLEPLPPCNKLLIVRAAVPGVWIEYGENPDVALTIPPEMVLVTPLRTSTPPLETFSVLATPLVEPRANAPPVSNVSEFTLDVGAAAIADVINMLVLAVNVVVVLYSDRDNGRRMAVVVVAAAAASPVANDVPNPVVDVSIKAKAR